MTSRFTALAHLPGRHTPPSTVAPSTGGPNSAIWSNCATSALSACRARQSRRSGPHRRGSVQSLGFVARRDRQGHPLERAGGDDRQRGGSLARPGVRPSTAATGPFEARDARLPVGHGTVSDASHGAGRRQDQFDGAPALRRNGDPLAGRGQTAIPCSPASADARERRVGASTDRLADGIAIDRGLKRRRPA